MDLSKVYTCAPFSIKENYEVLWHALCVLSLGKYRVPQKQTKWTLPEVSQVTLVCTGQEHGFLKWKTPENTKHASTPVQETSSAYIAFFSSSLRYCVSLYSKRSLATLKVYTAQDRLLPALNIQGKPLTFSGPCNELQFEVQGLTFLFLHTKTKIQTGDLTLKIEAKRPYPNMPTLEKRICLVKDKQKETLYSIRKEGRYLTAHPNPQLANMHRCYLQAQAAEEIPFPPLTFNSYLATGVTDFALSFFNESEGEIGSYLFVPSLQGQYVTNEINGVYTGLRIPLGKKAVLEFPALAFIPGADFNDEGDWEFTIETGSVQSLSYYRSYTLERNGDSYRLPQRIEIEDVTKGGLVSFSFHITNIGRARGIQGVRLNANCRVFLE